MQSRFSMYILFACNLTRCVRLADKRLIRFHSQILCYSSCVKCARVRAKFSFIKNISFLLHSRLLFRFSFSLYQALPAESGMQSPARRAPHRKHTPTPSTAFTIYIYIRTLSSFRQFEYLRFAIRRNVIKSSISSIYFILFY